MNNEAERNESRTESVSNSLTKRSWQSPEIEEVDLAETEFNISGSGTDSAAYS